MKSKNIKINGLTQKVDFWGNPKKPKLFLFHGWLDMGASFHFVCQKLQKDFYCIAPDMRGYGKSQHTSSELGYFFVEYIADMHALLNKFSPKEPVNLLGHSLSGNIVSLYAGCFPERVHHLINVEGFGFRSFLPKDGPQRLRDWVEKNEVKPFPVHPSLNALAKRLRMANPKLTLPRSKFLAKHLGVKVKGGYRVAADDKHKMFEPYLHPLKHHVAFWKKIKAECLLIAPDKSEIANFFKGKKSFKEEISRRMNLYPKESKKVIIKNSGHMVHFDQPEKLASIVKSFLIS